MWKKSFEYLGYKLWNTMPLEIKNSISLQDLRLDSQHGM